MQKVTDLSKGRWLGLILILILAAGLAILFTRPAPGTQPQTFTSPPPPTGDPRFTLRDDLWQMIELEEAQPGEARRQAGGDYVFDKEGRIGITITFDEDRMPISKSEPLEQQEAAQLVMAHGGSLYVNLGPFHDLAAYVPLARIKDLAREVGVIYIIPNEVIYPDWPPVTVVTPP